MTKKQALKYFRDYVLPSIKRQYEKTGIDFPARREAWNNYTDALCKIGTITIKQYNNWTNPF